MEVQRHERFLHRGHRTPATNRSLAEPLESRPPDLHHPVQLGRGILTVVPQVHLRMRAAGWSRVLVADEGDAVLARVDEDLPERGRLVRSFREVRVAEVDGDLVPLPHSRRVGIRQVDVAIARQLDQRMRIVHHRRAPLHAGDVVVGEPERVTHLVSRQLSDPGQGHLLELGRNLIAAFVRRQQPFGDQVVLAHAQRAEAHVPFDDLAGAGVGHRRSVAPTARESVDPLDHVVANVERVRPGRQHLDTEGVLETGALESGIPPASSVEQRGPDGLRRPRVEVVDDGLHGFTEGRARVLLLEPVAADQPPLHPPRRGQSRSL